MHGVSEKAKTTHLNVSVSMPEWWWKQCRYSRKAFAWECFKPFPNQIGIHNTLKYAYITYGDAWLNPLLFPNVFDVRLMPF